MTRRHYWLSGGIGAALWLAAALVIRGLPMLFDGGLWLLVLYLVTIPAGWVLVDLLARAVGAAPERVLRAVATAVVAACLIEGLALSYATGLYGPIASYTPFGAAWLLWAVGCALGAALHRSRA